MRVPPKWVALVRSEGPVRVAVVDYDDSFSDSIADLAAQAGASATVVGCEGALDEVEALRPTHLVLSAGPGSPADARAAGNARRLLDACVGRLPILGICLGHQMIARTFGAAVTPAQRPRHGTASRVAVLGSSWLLGDDEVFSAMCYHSLVVERDSVRCPLKVSAVSVDSGEVMALESESGLGLAGVQFHPESIGTPAGMRLMERFVNHRVERKINAV